MGDKLHLQSRVNPLESFLPLNVVLFCVFSFSTVFFNARMSSGAPNDGFLLNTLKTLLRLSRVLLVF